MTHNSLRESYVIRCLGAFALSLASAAGAETLANADVVALHAAGVSDDVILAKMHATAGAYDTSTAQLIALKAKGVSSAVMAAMIGAPKSGMVTPAPVTIGEIGSDSPASPTAPGVYLVDGPGHLTRIDATGANQAKSGGVLGYALTGGLASMSVKAVIPGGTARTHSSSLEPVPVPRRSIGQQHLHRAAWHQRHAQRLFSGTADGERRQTRGARRQHEYRRDEGRGDGQGSHRLPL